MKKEKDEKNENQIEKKMKEKQKWIDASRDKTRIVPFVVPNEEERMSALGSLAGEKWTIKKSLQAIIAYFDPIKQPEPDDYLFTRHEDGQGFGLFASVPHKHIDLQIDRIFIATFHCKLSQQAIMQFKRRCKKFFLGAKVKIKNFNEKVDLQMFAPQKTELGDILFNAAKMNIYFAKNLPKNCYCLAVLTNLLLYNGDNPVENVEDSHVFGLGSIKDRTCCISVEGIARQGLQNEKITGDLEQEDRLTICHTFSMRHCIFYECIMNGSSGFEAASKKAVHLCPVCLRKLQSQLEFDIAKRYQKLGDQKSLELASVINSVLGKNK